MLLIFSFFIYLPKIFFGFWIAHSLWREPSPQALWFKFFLGIPLGLGLWSLAYFLWIWTGWNRFIFPWLEVIISMAIIVLAWPGLKLPACFTLLNLRQLKSPLNLVFLLVNLVVAALFGVWLYMNPHGYEDAWFIWNLDSRFIYLAQDFRILYAPGGPGWHPDYPLLVSLNVVSGWIMLGQDSTRIQIVVAALFTLALPGILYFGLALLKGSKQAVLATIVLLASPLIIQEGASQQADIPIASFILASMTLVALYFKTLDSNLLFLGGLTTSLTAWTKNEGFLFIVINATLLVVFLITLGRIRSIKKYALGLAIPLSVILFYKFSIPVTNDLLSQYNIIQLLDLNRYRFILSSLVEFIVGLGWWPTISLAGVLIVYALLARFEYPEPLIVKFVGLALLIHLFGYIAIYVLSPHDLVWHLKTSIQRLLLHLFPASMFLFFYSIRAPDFNFLLEWKNPSHH